MPGKQALCRGTGYFDAPYCQGGFFTEYGRPCESTPRPRAADTRGSCHYANSRNTFQKLLEWGVIPVVSS